MIEGSVQLYRPGGEPVLLPSGIDVISATIDGRLSAKSDTLIVRFMKKTSISVTEASRNSADCVNRAHYQNVTFALLKNGEPVAPCTGQRKSLCWPRFDRGSGTGVRNGVNFAIQ
jgi:hypothetical protein